MRSSRSNFISSILLIVTTVTLGACGGGSGDGNGGGGAAVPRVFATFVSNNGPANRGTVDQYDSMGMLVQTFTTGNNQGIALDLGGNAVQAGDVNSPVDPGSIVFISAIGSRGDGAMFELSCDRVLGGAGTVATGLVGPKGLEIAHLSGLLIVADNGAGDVKIFGTAAGGDVAPLGTTAVPAPPWDVVYDETSDRLFVALTDGTCAVFDGWAADGFGESGPTRLFFADDGLVKISVNFHGIDYDPVNDMLVITDVGNPAINDDGVLFVFDFASQRNGRAMARRAIEGPSSMLGNPVDVVFTQGAARVAEKSNDAILVFENVVLGPDGDSAPNSVITQTKPESVGPRVVNIPVPADATDLDNPTVPLLGVAMTSNPGVGMTGHGIISRIDEDLLAATASFSSGLALENVVFDVSGDAFVTFDDGTGTNGGVFVVNRLARSRDGDMIDASRDRSITGPMTGLVAPKGLDVSSADGLLFVADQGATDSAVFVFGTQASGNVPPVFATNLSAFGRAWDLDYDARNDRLFVALTNGQVAVFDAYVGNTGANPPDRMIIPTDGVSQVSVNLHGIAYDASANALILSDVGAPGDATDGQLFVIEQAAGADGPTPASVIIGGPATMLGNPVDIAYDGANLYVAEKSNAALLRFDFIRTSAGGDLAPDLVLSRPAPESVCVLPATLSSTP